MEHKLGLGIALAVFIAVALIIYFNLQPHEPSATTPQLISSDQSSSAKPAPTNPLTGIETFIGETERNGMLIAAVWLPAIQMEAQSLPEHSNVIHLEADIHATEGNRNGFGLGAWMPYLTVMYDIQSVGATADAIRGELLPMVAKDGPHYGATIELPGPGKYHLTYHIDNPSKKGFGRHSDPITGVDPWWDAFDVSFDFDYQSRLSITK